MSLEKSVLDIDKIRGLLNSEYGLELLDCISLELGSANCYKVHCKEGVSQKFNGLLSALDENKSDSNYVRIHDDLVFKMKLMDSIDAWKEYFKGITYTSTHGDYTACQLICDGGRIKAVIDFSSAGCIPAVWEIMRSYIQSGGVSRNGSYFDVEDFSLYVKEYVKYSPLTERDLEAMPYIYLFQLAQSSYGYKEYLVTKTENKEALLDFGFWRTDICREIYKKASDISAALLQGERKHGNLGCI